MATTTNYGWTTPNDTDLVKDGAAAIRTLGSSIDTTTKALNPSTTLGDVEYRSATANTNTRFPIGTSGLVLAVNGSGVPAWTTVSSGSMTLLSTTSLTGASVTVSGISGDYNNLFVLMRGVSQATDGAYPYIYPNGSSSITDNYAISSYDNGWSIVYDGQIRPTRARGTMAATTYNSTLTIFDYANTTTAKMATFQTGYIDTGGTPLGDVAFGNARIKTNSAITSLQFQNVSGNFDAGTVLIYGVK